MRNIQWYFSCLVGSLTFNKASPVDKWKKGDHFYWENVEWYYKSNKKERKEIEQKGIEMTKEERKYKIKWQNEIKREREKGNVKMKRWKESR